MPDPQPPSFIAGIVAAHYLRRQMPRLFSSLLLFLALLLSPLAMVSGGGFAHAAVQEAASSGSHCSGESSAPRHDRAADMEIGCAMACAAVPAAQPRIGDQVLPKPLAPVLIGHQLLSGIQPEGETPPPRIHPEI